jgi:hypothetical protein
MPTMKFRVGDRVEDIETHERGRVVWVYSEFEFIGEVVEVLFDRRDDALKVSVDSIRKITGRPP